MESGEPQFKASPGIAILEEVKEQETAAIIGTTPKTGRICKGKILSMGRNLVTDANAILEAEFYGQEGDIVYFLHYYDEGGYDYRDIDGKRYYFVKWQDFRGKAL